MIQIKHTTKSANNNCIFIADRFLLNESHRSITLSSHFVHNTENI